MYKQVGLTLAAAGTFAAAIAISGCRGSSDAATAASIPSAQVAAAQRGTSPTFSPSPASFSPTRWSTFTPR